MFNIINLDSVETLMDEIKKYPLNTFLTAKEQTKGRGKDNRVWTSKRSNNLYFAFNIEVDKYINYYSFVSSLCVLKAIKDIFKDNIKLNLKWPNDVLLNEKKFCGMLLEKNDNILVVGIGINIDFFPDNTNFKATSLLNEGFELNKDIFINNFIKNFENLQNNINNFGFNIIKNEWLNFAYKINEEIKVKIDNVEYIGIFDTINEDGALILKTKKEEKKFYSADVFDI